MEIRIKGFDMPKDCGTCELCTGDGKCMALYGENLWNYIPDDAEYFPNDWKYEGCPVSEGEDPATGHWIDVGAGMSMFPNKCSKCGERQGSRSKYCPECGAKMIGT